MTKTDRFQDLAAFRAEKLRAAAKSDMYAERLENHMDSLKQGEFRGKLLKNTVSSALGGSTPGKILGSIIGSAGLGGALSMAAGSGKGGLMKRAGLFALGLAAPQLLKKVEYFSISDIGHELGVSWERLKDHLEDRREERELRKVKDELEDEAENVQL